MDTRLGRHVLLVSSSGFRKSITCIKGSRNIEEVQEAGRPRMLV